MKLCLVLLALSAMAAAAPTEFKPNSSLDARWERYKKQFEKTYANKEEELKRRQIWEGNVAEIDRHNQEFKEGKHTYTLAENKFADMTEEEKKQFIG